ILVIRVAANIAKGQNGKRVDDFRNPWLAWRGSDGRAFAGLPDGRDQFTRSQRSDRSGYVRPRLRLSLEQLQLRQHLRRTLISQALFLLQRLTDHLVQSWRDIGIHVRGIDRISVEDRFGDDARTRTLKRNLTRGHLVEDDAKRKQIAATIQF